MTLLRRLLLTCAAGALLWTTVARAQDARPFPDLEPNHLVQVNVYVKNASNGTAVPGRNVYLVRDEARVAGDSRPFSYFEAEETDVEGTARMVGALMPGTWSLEVYGGSLFDNAVQQIVIQPGVYSYQTTLALKPFNGRYQTRDLPFHPAGERGLYIRVQGRDPKTGQNVPVRYAEIYSLQGHPIVMTGYDGTAVIWHTVPLGEMSTLKAEALHWEPGTASFISGAAESGSRLTRSDDYINFVLNSNETPEQHNVLVRVQGRQNGSLVPVHYAMIYDSQGHEVVMTGYDGTATAKVYDLPVGEEYQLHAEANHWKNGTATVTVGAQENSRLTSGNDRANFILEPEAGEEAAPLTIQVLNHSTDKPIAGATVTLYKPNRFPGTAVSHGTTNSDGEISFTAEEIAAARLNGEARVGATHGDFTPNVQNVSSEQLSKSGTNFALFLRPLPSGFDLSGDWVFTWTWSVTSVDFIGKVSGGPHTFSFSGKVLGGGNAIWTAKAGTATCSLNAANPKASTMSCSASFPPSGPNDKGGSWTGQTTKGQFSATIYGKAKKFDYRGAYGHGQASGNPPAGIDLFELKPKG